MSAKKRLNPDWPRSSSADFAQGIQVGDTIYVSGQVAQAPDGALVGEGDMQAQARQVFANIEAVLALGGATLNDIAGSSLFGSAMSSCRATHIEMLPPAEPPNAAIRVGSIFHSVAFVRRNWIARAESCS